MSNTWKDKARRTVSDVWRETGKDKRRASVVRKNSHYAKNTADGNSLDCVFDYLSTDVLEVQREFRSQRDTISGD